jgi:hypothetical protein
MPGTIAIDKMRTDVQGRVIGPDDPEYDEARTLFYGGMNRRPAVIVRVANDADVVRVIALARETGLELAVRSGGHSIPGHSVSEGGIVLDLGDLRGIDIDPDGGGQRRGSPRWSSPTPPTKTGWRWASGTPGR